MSLPVCISAFVLCAAVSFVAVRSGLPGERSASAAAVPVKAAATAGEIPVPALTAEASAMIAEWERLRAQNGGAATDLGALYLSVKDLESSFRRRAYRSAIMAEWAKRDPGAALRFLLEKDAGNARQLAREWLRLDPQAAISHLLNGDEKTRKILTDVLGDIAKACPERLGEVLARAPKPDDVFDRSGEKAFAIFARKDLQAACDAAESLTSHWRSQAFAGIASAMGEQDGPGALAWAQTLSPGDDRDAALRATLIGWAKTDPMAALENIDAAPPGERNSYTSDVGAQVLSEAGKKDWDGTLRWLKEHPGKLGQPAMYGLMNIISQRLNADVAGTLRSLAGADLEALNTPFGGSILNEGYAHREAVWTWLESQPPSEFVKNARLTVISAIGYKEPWAALEFFEKLPDNEASRELLQLGVRSLTNNGERQDILEDLLAKASPKMRPHLIENAMTFENGTMTATPQTWIERINELPANRRSEGYAGLANAWINTDPEAALNWVQSLGEIDADHELLGNAFDQWVGRDLESAAAWVDKLPAGAQRDTSSASLASALVRTQPEAAWNWAASIRDSERRMDTLAIVYSAIAEKDLARADHLIDQGNLSAAEREAIRLQRTNQ